MRYKAVIACLLIGIMLLSSFPMIDQIGVDGIDGDFGGGSGTVNDPYVIEDVWDLQAMNENLSAHFILGNDIDASETKTWNDGAGFIPIGEKFYDISGWTEHPFTGSLGGNGHTISGIYIYDLENSSIISPSSGLFGYIGSEGRVMDLELMGLEIEGNNTVGYTVGGLVGYNEGLISNCFFQGSVSGVGGVGGLVGANDQGSVINCHTDVNLNDLGTLDNIGGLIGVNNGKVEDCSSTGIVTGSFYTGGLIGANGGGFINNSYSTCEVNSDVAGGGLIGRNNEASISDCYATGSVYGTDYVGGLIGWNEGNVLNCHSTGDIRGMEGRVGGLLGVSTGDIANCYSTGDVYGGGFVGGLIGDNYCNVSNSHSTGEVSGMGDSVGGLLGHSTGDIANCFSTGDVYGANHVGGFVGGYGGWGTQTDSNIIGCFSSGNVTGAKVAVGGFAGYNYGPVKNCYSVSNVIGSAEVGGFIGSNNGGTASNCYSIGEVGDTENDIGGFVGVNQSLGEKEGSFEHCYWNIDTSGQTESEGGEGKTTIEMRSRVTYVSWDFSNVWGIIEGEDFPYLQALLNAQGARILSPKHIGTLVEGDSLRFRGSSSPDPNIGYLWTFGDDRTSSSKNPGLIQFSSPGTEDISYSFTLNRKEYLKKDTMSFDVIDGTPSFPDLRVTSINVPETLAIDETAAITYTVVNSEEATVTGETWKDSIYLSNDPYLDSMDMMLNSTIVSKNISKNGGYAWFLNITIPPLVEGPYYLIMSANDEWSFVERHRLNNEKEVTFNIAIPELKEGIEHNSEYPIGTLDQYYMIKLPSSKNIHLTLEGPDGLEMMVRHGDLPTRSKHDHHSDNGELSVQSAYSGKWYVLVHGDDMVDSGSFSIKFDVVELILEDVAPSRHIIGVPVDLILRGIGFAEPLQVIFVGSDGTNYEVPLVNVNTPNLIIAYVKGNLLPVDIYDTRVVRPGNGSSELKDSLEILEEGEAKFEASIDPGPWTGYHEHSIVYVEYANTGDISMRAPLLFLTAISGPDDRRGCMLTHDEARLEYGIWTAGMKAGTIPETPADLVPEGFQNELMILASGEIPGILQAGETRRIPIYYAGWEPPYPAFGSDLEWQLYIITEEDDNIMDWDGAKEKMIPEDISEDAWNVIWENFKNEIGPTYGDFIQTLNDNALHLYQFGQRIEDVDEILSLTLQQANGWTPYSSVYSRNDIGLDDPGLDLTLERYYPNSISRRFEEGDLGRGWMHNWQYSLEKEVDGTVKIKDNTGNVRIFQPNVRSYNAYMSQPGDWGKLKKTPLDNFILQEKYGNTLFFNSDGTLGYIEDTNGNSITCQYVDGSLGKLVHSSGSYIQISYNGDGLIDQITDSYDRTNTYSYDDGYLTSVEYFDGYNEVYYYDKTEGSPSEHALTGITPLGDSRIYITYNSHGAISSHYREEELERHTFVYGQGLVRITDLLGNTERFFHDHQGRVIRYDNALGDSYCVIYDGLGMIETITDPAGLSIEYDNFKGNIIEMKDRAGYEYQVKYDQELDLMERIIYPDGSSMGYDLDDNGNLIGIIHPDGSAETGSYDEKGNLITLTNRRGNTTSFSHDSKGRITSKRYTDGSEIVYNYDDRGNLISMEDSTGVTNYTYNSNDLLTHIDYPNGQWLSFTYDNARRRSASIDHLGNRINYDYDHAGRLEGLMTSTGIDIVKYEYDPLGRLSTKTLENGVYTTYGYDAAGRITKLANFKPDETVISWFRYTYDACGRIKNTSNREGNWHYSYDDRDQLVKAVFDPCRDPEAPAQDIEYNYDSMGNRVRTVLNGVEEFYQSNELNQYIMVGNVSYTYDSDGNLISEAGPNGTTTYTYNDDNRLISVSKGEDIWSYTYDGLGNRVSITENGNSSYLVVDPMGMGEVVGAYDENGTMMSRYIYGSDLVSMETGTGESYFYNFDLMGNTQELTDSTGASVNSYSYMPFGDIISEQGSVPNPFRFVGEKGVMTDTTGLVHMRARQYDPQTGRFTSMDPLGIGGNDLNLYRYVHNSPTNLVDPEGLFASAASNYVPWGTLAEGASSNFISSTDAQFVGAGVDIVTGVSTLLSLGTLAAVAPIAAPLLIGAAVVIAAVGIYKGIKFIASLFDFEPANTLTPLDPNHKECLMGIGPGNHVAEGTQLSYIVEFENMEEATAPAQIVTILDPLSEDLDWSTFEFTEIGFGDFALPLEPGTTYVDEVMEYSYKDDDYDMEIELHIIGEIDTTKGEVFVMIDSIDPITQLPPEVNIGFLPPEDDTGRGQGYFMYNIDPRSDLPSGTEIRNVATIQFNLGMEIDTNQIDPLDRSKGTSPDLEALVTIDAGPPESQVNALTEHEGQNFTVSWSGQDDEGGSGIAGYDIYLKENEEPWTLWLEGTNLTSSEFNGTVNSTYGFYSVATDYVGHREEKDQLSEAITTVSIISAPTANAGPDQTVEKGTNVTFDGSGSTDEIGIVTYTWTFNDGYEDVILDGVSPLHHFEIPGNYTITLNVTSNAGLWDTDTMVVTVVEVADQDDDDDDKDDDKENGFPYLLFVIVLVLVIILILGAVIIIIMVKPRKGLLDEE